MLLSLAAPCVAAAERAVPADAWASPRSGQAMLGLEALRATVREWMRAGPAHIRIHHPGGETGSLWAAELRDWVVALGVPSSRVRLVPGGSTPDAVTLTVTQQP